MASLGAQSQSGGGADMPVLMMRQIANKERMTDTAIADLDAAAGASPPRDAEGYSEEDEESVDDVGRDDAAYDVIGPLDPYADNDRDSVGPAYAPGGDFETIPREEPMEPALRPYSRRQPSQALERRRSGQSRGPSAPTSRRHESRRDSRREHHGREGVGRSGKGGDRRRDKADRRHDRADRRGGHGERRRRRDGHRYEPSMASSGDSTSGEDERRGRKRREGGGRRRSEWHSESSSYEGGDGSESGTGSEEYDEADEQAQESAGPYRHVDPARAHHEQEIRRSMADYEAFRGTTQRETEEQERIELLYRMRQLEKEGFPPSRRVLPTTTLDEVRYELYRQTREANRERGLKWLRQLLVTAARFLEFANLKFNPFELNLRGFSRSVALSVADYDQPLLSLHNHYSGRGASMHPVAQIGLTLGGAMIFHHATNTPDDVAAPPRRTGAAMRGMAQQSSSNPLEAMGAAAAASGGRTTRRPMTGPPSDTDGSSSAGMGSLPASDATGAGRARCCQARVRRATASANVPESPGVPLATLASKAARIACSTSAPCVIISAGAAGLLRRAAPRTLNA
ncbi:hypothetical protein JKP88DRAFT_273040 [Tribonema minus]|uniref:Uncharacterized protein n=1 Tax=Tribonema minus TaxID=303371 RepID=A0A836CEV7_9STRA|nr:hypothetical protein JKP88DRAFT_273040 [Tribonema minus]